MDWVKLKEKKPELNTPVLIYADSKIGMAELHEDGRWMEVQNWTLVSGDRGHYSIDKEVEEHQITHWALPGKPDEG